VPAAAVYAMIVRSSPGEGEGVAGEFAIIEAGDIPYKHAEVHEVSANVNGKTAIVLNKVTLLAVVGGHEVTNLFEVTEANAQEDHDWTIVALSFAKLLTQDLRRTQAFPTPAA
jgi:4-carboxymuconolactone decarboxylase